MTNRFNATIMGAICAAFLVFASHTPASAQDKYPTPPNTTIPTPLANGSTVGVVQDCVNSSGQAVPNNLGGCVGGIPSTIANGADSAEGSTTDPACALPASGAACTMTALTKAIANVLSFAASPTASITRTANTTTYTANTAWNNGTPTFFSFTGACRVPGGRVIITEIDIWSSANPALKLQGILWLFAGVPAANIADNAAFNIAAGSGNPPTGDFSLLTGNRQGFAFTLANDQSTGANSAVSLTGTNYQAKCASGTTTITGMAQVVNAYVPANAEILTMTLNTIGAD